MFNQQRISLDLWELVQRLNSDVEIEGLLDGTGEPDLEDSLSHGFERGLERYSRHCFYLSTRQRYTVITITILAVACLEAYMNELIAFVPGLSEKDRKTTLRLRLRDKYQRFRCLLSGSPFPVRAEPFESFSLLVTLRNVLVHFDLTSHSTEHTPHPPTLDLLASKIAGLDPLFVIPDDLVTPGFPPWIKSTVALIIGGVNQVVPDSRICIDPDQSPHQVGKLWQKGFPESSEEKNDA